MNANRLTYLFNNGKNAKFPYYLKAFSRLAIPSSWLHQRLQRLLDEIESRPDREEIHKRAEYYNKLNTGISTQNEGIRYIYPADMPSISDMRPGSQKVYYLDTMEYARYFNPRLKLLLKGGDNTIIPPFPSIVKSRPIAGANANAVLLNLDKVRHFIFYNDKRGFEEKDDRALFRGKACGKPNRIMFMNRFWGNPRFHLATIDAPRKEWKGEKLTLSQQLRNRYIMALEGNDVASNLKWVMSSNSIAVTPRMKYETWFMEGLLKGGEHYIEVADDFSDVEEKIDYYSSHQAEAREIIENAHRFVNRFRNQKREKLISLLVLDRYLKAVNPDFQETGKH